jgi:hypothetical protein
VIGYNIYKHIKNRNKVYLVVAAGAITAFSGLIISYQNKKAGDIIAQVGYSVFIIGLTHCCPIASKAAPAVGLA